MPFPHRWPWASYFALRFANLEMEEAYVLKRAAQVGHISKLWCAVQVTLCLLWFFFSALRYRLFWRPSLAAFLPEPIPFLTIGAVLLSNFMACCRPCTHILTYTGSLIIVGFLAWKVHFHVVQETFFAEAYTMKAVYTAVQNNTIALGQLQVYVNQEESRKALTFFAVQMLVQFNVLQFLGLGIGTACVYLSFPVALFMAAYVSPVVADAILEISIISTVLSLTSLSSSFQVSRIQRQQFASDHKLQVSLEREAETSQRLAEHERRAKEAAMQADTILNHMLKNIMADAAGCIWLFAATTSDPIPPDLQTALACLDRGMRWCRQRQALLRLTAGTYRVSRVPVGLRAFGEALASGRALDCVFVDDCLLLDPLLCDILLDNAINNALRHGDAAHPVTFSMQLEPASPDERSATLTFTVTNRLKPSKPAVTPEFVQAVLRGEVVPEPGNSLSDHLGLQHIFMAADAHDIQLALQQEADMVVLRASLAVQREPRNDASVGLRDPCPGEALQGLHILCLDDSEVARRLLGSTFRRALPGCVVEVFGSDAREVEAFLDAARDRGDILVLDHHLVYPEAQFTGTQLLAQLLRSGFSGFACMRSANMSPEDQTEYFATGAHCCLGKDVRPPDMVATLVSSYVAHRRGLSQPAAPLSACDQVSEATSGDIFLQLTQVPGSSTDSFLLSKSLSCHRALQHP